MNYAATALSIAFLYSNALKRIKFYFALAVMANLKLLIRLGTLFYSSEYKINFY